MGRELRRVPLDFGWPLHKVWAGFMMPDSLELPTCAACGGEGYGPEARAVASTFYPHQVGGPNADALAWHDKLGQAEVDHLVEAGYLRHCQVRQPDAENPRLWEWVAVPRLAADVNAAQAARRLLSELGLDCGARYIAIEFRCDVLGIKKDCPACDGRGDVGTVDQRVAAESWEGTGPPTGDGWQVWETVSEGSPVSPVFATRDELVAWLIGEGYTALAAERFAVGGWAPSMMIGGGRVVQNIQSLDMEGADGSREA